MAFAVPKYARQYARCSSPILRPKSASEQRGHSDNASPGRSMARTLSHTGDLGDGRKKGKSNKGGDITATEVFQKLHKTTGSSRSLKETVDSDGNAHPKSKNGNGKTQTAASKLRRMGTGPSEKILQQHMWKHFFGGRGYKENSLSVDSTDAHTSQKSSSDRNQVSATSHTDGDVVNPAEEDAAGVDCERLYRRLVRRVKHLWKELSIPHRDRDFYTVAFIKEGFCDSSQIDDLSCYIKRLLDHRQDTIGTVKAINERERLVEQCNALISVALRYQNMKYSTLYKEDSSDQISNATNKEDELKKEIRRVISALQTASCYVVRMIRLWREGLWRPQPFVFRGKNYLTRMKTDLDFLRSKSVQRVLDSIPVTEKDLACVTFAPFETGTITNGPLPGGDLEESINLGDNQFEQSVSENIQSSAQQRYTSPEVEAPLPPNMNKVVTGYEDLILVVANEGNVQRALQLETAALHARGTFIPSLRFELDDESDKNLNK